MPRAGPYDPRKRGMIRMLQHAHEARKRKSDRETQAYLEHLQHMTPSERGQMIARHQQSLTHDLTQGKRLLGRSPKAYDLFASKRRGGLAYPLPDGSGFRDSERTYTPDEWIARFG